MKKLSNQDDKKRGVNMITLNQEQNITITTRVVVTWENPYSQTEEYQERIRERQEKESRNRMFKHAHWNLDEIEEREFLTKIRKGELTQFTEKETALLKAIEQGNQNGGQIGNYGLCVAKAQAAWRRDIIVKDSFFMPFEAEVEEDVKEGRKIYIVMYHESVEWEYSHTSVEAVFNTELEAQHWIAAKIKREQKKKRQTKEFIEKGGDPRNLPYEKEYNNSIWANIWYTIQEKTIG